MPTSVRPSRRSWYRWMVGITLSVAVAAQLIRISGAPTWDTVWLEDGPVFVQDANGPDGPFGSMLKGYAGYLQLVPRLLAAPTAWVPVGWIAPYAALVAAMVTALAGWFVVWASRGWVASGGVRLAMAAVLVIGPAVAVENTAVITNTIWLGLAVTPWALLARQADTRAMILRSGVTFLAAACTPLLVTQLPLAALVLGRRRDRATLAVATGLVAGLALQAATVTTSATQEPGSSDPGLLVARYVMRVVGSVVVGEAPLSSLWISSGARFGYLAVVVLAGVILWAGRGLGSRTWLVCLGMVGLSIITFLVPSHLRGTPERIYGYDTYSTNGTRFTVAPIFFLVSAVALVVDPVVAGQRVSEERRSRARVARRIFMVHTSVVIASSFWVTTARSAGPLWSEEVGRARAEACGPGVDADEEVVIPTAPAGFRVILTCDRIRR